MSEELRPRAFGGPANQPWFDRYTSAHAGVGIAAAYYRLPWWATVAVVVGWEVIENELKDRFPSLFPYSSHDSLGNSLVDAGAALGAYFSARAMLGDPDLSPRTRAAIAAGATATVGGIVGSVVFGLVGKLVAGDMAGSTNRFGSIGYLAGAAAGGGIGLMLADPASTEVETALAAGGGAVGGPLGAVLAAYAAQGRLR